MIIQSCQKELQITTTEQNQQQMTIGQPVLCSSFLKMLNDKNIDWNGNCEFKDGKVVGFLKDDFRNNYQMRPIPRGLKASNDALEAQKTLNGMMTPSTRDQVSIALKKLSIHCGKQNKTPQEINSMLADYYNDIGMYPIKLIEDACEQYRKQPENNNFMPNSGQLIAIMADKYHKMKFIRKRIDMILGKEVKEPKKNRNRPVSLMEAIEILK